MAKKNNIVEKIETIVKEIPVLTGVSNLTGGYLVKVSLPRLKFLEKKDED